MLKTYLAVSASVAALLCAAPALAATAVITVDRQSDLTANPGTAAGQLAVANGSNALGDGGGGSQYYWLPSPTPPGTGPTQCPLSSAAPFQEAAGSGLTAGFWCMLPPAKLDLRQAAVFQDYTGLVSSSPGSITYTASGNDLIVSTTAVGGFANFPYTAAGDTPITVQVSGLTQGASTVPAPNGAYRAVWQANTAGVVTGIKLLGVAAPAGAWGGTLTLSYSPIINNTTGPNHDNHDAIQAAINYACAANIDIVDGPGGEATARPFDVLNCQGEHHWRFTALRILDAPHGQSVGWDEGLFWVKRVRYETPGDPNGTLYATPGTSTTDQFGNGYVWNPPASDSLWPTANIAKVFDSGVSNGAGHNLVAIEFQSPVVVGKGQQVRIHGSNVGGSNPLYLEGMQTVYDTPSTGYEGCSIAMPSPCAVTAVILANTDTSQIATLPQYDFASVQNDGTNKSQLNLPVTPPFGAPTAAHLTIANAGYPSYLIGTNMSFSTPGGSNGQTVITTAGHGFPGSATSPTALPQGVVAIALPHAVFNLGSSYLSGAHTNANNLHISGLVDCALVYGCVGFGNYSDNGTNYVDDFNVTNWNHSALITWGEGARTYISAGNYSQNGQGPGNYQPTAANYVSNPLGTLGYRTGIGALWGNTGDSVEKDGPIFAYNYLAWLTEADTHDIAISAATHTYNGLGANGPYYPNAEGIFYSDGSFDHAMFDAGQIMVGATKGVTPYVQITGNYDYAGYSKADAPLVIQSDVWCRGCVSLPKANGQPQGLDPNQLAAPTPIAIGGYEYGSLALEDPSGNAGNRVWSQNSQAVSAYYNSAGVNSYDNPLTSSISGPAYTFTGNISAAQTSVTTTAAVAGGLINIPVSSVANLLAGMVLNGNVNLPTGVTIAAINPAGCASPCIQISGSGLLNSGLPNGTVLVFPYVTTTVTADTGNVVAIPVASVAGIFPGAYVLGPNATLGNAALTTPTPAISSQATVLNVDAASKTVYLSIPAQGGDTTGTHPALPSGTVLAFQGVLQNYAFGLSATDGYTISSASLLPFGGSSIAETAGSGPLTPGSFHASISGLSLSVTGGAASINLGQVVVAPGVPANLSIVSGPVGSAPWVYQLSGSGGTVASEAMTGVYAVADVQPWNNIINLFQGGNGGNPPNLSVQQEPITIGGDSAHWKADVVAGSWQLFNVSYGGVKLANLWRQGMTITDSLGCLDAGRGPWWIDGMNYARSTVQVENASDDALAGGAGCGSDTFTVTPFSYVLQAADAGLTVQVNTARAWQFYLQPAMPAGWSVNVASALSTVTGGGAIPVQVLNANSGPFAQPVAGLNNSYAYSSPYGALAYVNPGWSTPISNGGAQPGGTGINYTLNPGYTGAAIAVSASTGATYKMNAKQFMEVFDATSTATALTLWLPPYVYAGDAADVANQSGTNITVTLKDGSGAAVTGSPYVVQAHSGVHIPYTGVWTPGAH